MTNPDIAWQRLQNQQLIAAPTTSPVEIVRQMGAVQSQDYPGAKWAVGQRAGVAETVLEQAVNEGSLLRLHVMRPTWHFVPAEDAGWLLALTGPRVIRASAARLRELELGDAVLERSLDVFRGALAGGRQMTRAEIEGALQQAGISTTLPQRLVYFLMIGELHGVICSGAWRGKQSTYALLEERVPRSVTYVREEALGELARRYFTSHGPASLKDFTWWSGLTVADARLGIEIAGSSLIKQEIEGVTYWGPANPRISPLPSPIAHLLPSYDEYVVAYTDRGAIFDSQHAHRLRMRGGMLNNVILMDGMVVGAWMREVKKTGVTVTAELLWPLADGQRAALEQAVTRYGVYMGCPAFLKIQS